MDVSCFDDALRDVFKAHDTDPNDVALLTQLAYGLNIRSYHEEAIEVARRGLGISPGNAGLYYELIIASSLDTEHILEEILDELEEILEAQPDDAGARRNLALVHYYLEHDDEAENILDALYDELGEPGLDRMTYEILAQMEYTRQNMEQCLHYCDLAVESPGPSARMVRLKGLCHIELGEDELAEAAFKKALELEPHFVWACHSVAGIYLEREDFAQALRYYGKASYINPTDPGNLFLPAEAFMDMGRYDLARGELSKLLLLEPDQRIEAEVQNALGYIALRQDNLDEARLRLNLAIELEPELALAYFNLGQVAQKLDDPTSAEGRFLQALELDPALIEAQVELGFMALNSDELDKAQDLFTEVLEVDDLEAQAYMGLSKIAQLREDPGAQIDFARQAYENDPDNSEICNNLGIAYECNNDFDTAEEVYVRALELDEDNAAAANNLGYLYEKKMMLYPEQEEPYRNKAIWAWKERLRICLRRDASIEGAVNHLRELGFTDEEISALARMEE